MREGGCFPLFLGMVRTSLLQCCRLQRIFHLLLAASILAICIVSFFLVEFTIHSIRPELRIDMKSDAPNAVRQQLLSILQSVPGVTDVVYVTREQALQHQATYDPQFVELLQKAGLPNPFNDAILLTLTHSDVRAKIAALLRQAPYTSAVDGNIFTILSDTSSYANDGMESRMTELVVPIKNFILLGTILVLFFTCLYAQRFTSVRMVLLQNFGISSLHSFFFRWLHNALLLLIVGIFAIVFSILLSQVLMKIGNLHFEYFTADILQIALLLLITSIVIPFFLALLPLKNPLFSRE